MPVNISTLESVIQTKLNALTGSSDSKEVIYLAKALESLDNGVMTTYSSYASLPAAAGNTGRVAYVQDNQLIYYSNGSTWVTLSTAQDPNFSISTLGVETLDLDDFLSITNAVVTTEDWDLITSPVDATDDWFQLSLVNKGSQGDIYIDPTFFTLTVYDGVTRAGVKHMAASRNNLDFDNMNSSQQGLIHLLKTTDTFIPQGTPTAVPFSSARIIDNRLGTFSGGYFTTNFEGWYLVHFSIFSDNDVYFMLGGSQSPIDNTTTTFANNEVYANRVVYLQKYETLRLYAMCDGVGTLVNRTVRAYDYNHPNLSQMTIQFIGK
jgi:hypothetical protein